MLSGCHYATLAVMRVASASADIDLDEALSDLLDDSRCDQEALLGALAMLDRGFSVIPVKPGAKQPLVSYDEQTESPQRLFELVLREIEAGHPQSFGVVPGPGDLWLDRDRGDDPDWLATLPETLTVQRGGHQHRYYRTSPDAPSRNGERVDDIDVRMVCRDGARHSLLVAPGSVHSTGERYEIVNDAPVATIDSRSIPSGNGRTDRVESDRTARARAIAERMPASIEHAGGDLALLKCATELGNILGDDSRAIESALGIFNERCEPPWPATKLRLEATRQARQQRDPMAKVARRRTEPERPREASLDAFLTLGKSPSWRDPIVPPAYLCEGLRLAPSEGKISLIAGQPGSGKGPIADHLAVCLALGLPAFGAFPCRRTPVLFTDLEGINLTRNRMSRMCRAMGHSPLDLEGWLTMVDASCVSDLTTDAYLSALISTVKDFGIGALFLDSYTAAMLRCDVEASSPQYARLAIQLGTLGILVLSVTHAAKSAGAGRPTLLGIAHSGALAAMAATAIVTHRPDPDDDHLVHVGCARAPETGFAGFDIRFSGAPHEPLAISVVEESLGETRSVEKDRQRMALVAKAADSIEVHLRQLGWAEIGATASKIQEALGLRGIWTDAIAECQRRGTVEIASLPSDRLSKWRLKP